MSSLAKAAHLHQWQRDFIERAAKAHSAVTGRDMGCTAAALCCSEPSLIIHKTTEQLDASMGGYNSKFNWGVPGSNH